VIDGSDDEYRALSMAGRSCSTDSRAASTAREAPGAVTRRAAAVRPDIDGRDVLSRSTTHGQLGRETYEKRRLEQLQGG
jgi:hypothetical protein